MALFLALGGVGVAALLGPIGQAIAKRLASGGKHPPDPKTGLTTGEMTAERVAHLEARLAELEERLDFAERVISQGSGERAALPNEGRTVER
jgi:hypothetical protein